MQGEVQPCLLTCNLEKGHRASRKNVSSECSHHGLHEAELIAIDGVAHAWVESCCNVAAKALQDFSGLLYSLFRDVGVYIATAEKDGCAGK
jgi:hypothetical protein